jgi:hypothetical protein
MTDNEQRDFPPTESAATAAEATPAPQWVLFGRTNWSTIRVDCLEADLLSTIKTLFKCGYAAVEINRPILRLPYLSTKDERRKKK